MPTLKLHRTEKTLSLSAGGTFTIGGYVPAKVNNASGKGYRVLSCTARVITAANGTGTLSVGVTGATAALMSTSDVGLNVAGKKTTATGSDLAGNGTVRTPGTTKTDFIATYTRGTDTNTPVVRVCILWTGDEPLSRLEVT